MNLRLWYLFTCPTTANILHFLFPQNGKSGCSLTHIPHRNTNLQILYHYFHSMKVISTSVKFSQFIVFTVYNEKVCLNINSPPRGKCILSKKTTPTISWWLTQHDFVVSTLIFVVSAKWFSAQNCVVFRTAKF